MLLRPVSCRRWSAGFEPDLYLADTLQSNCGRGLAPDGGGAATNKRAVPPRSGASPLPQDCVCCLGQCPAGAGQPVSNLTCICLALCQSNCGRGLAPDGGGSLFHRDRGKPPPTGLCVLLRAVSCRRWPAGFEPDLHLSGTPQSNCGRGLAPDGGGSTTNKPAVPPRSGASPLPHV